MQVAYYQVFDGNSEDSIKLVVNVQDAESGEVFDTYNYPDDLNS